ncbi:hypothetical protein AMJ39_05250 [candidate division TA06 bacterium DG_24]|uniref:Right handed beta helix domain-containing protein n=3 Tax=Bacteria division TA06 TaxID=1156500 RepID=A0A0S8JEC8_UNCT6|nr:MAG: hypothetical protein AMJ39_05250 [candidate division TA06 bacterium DG_24]KPK69780.1 MAG: hypothetical protein AMJ82_04895 [candidate division TA06 bacterium SM23_40]KPL07840.1 MAG: hypothetical protein AMJ71_08840 [candidate division TA06 bacterium SM1_40]
MNGIRLGAAIGVAAACLVSAAPATVIRVPQVYPTIQAGVNAAMEGDTVLVASGTYFGPGNYDIDFGGKAIVLMSESGPEATVIDCRDIACRGLYFHSGEDSSSVVRGFTITNAHDTGIYCWGSSPTIMDNIIRDNAGDNGGGIACEWNCSARIADNVITCNVANYGGAIYCNHSSPAVVGNTLTENSAYDGGGLFSELQSCPVIAGNTFSGNAAPGPYGGHGGAICIYQSSAVIQDNFVQWNVADYGGGIHCWYGSAVIAGNTILENGADKRGGGICCEVSSATVTDNTIIRNMVYNGSGGGIVCSQSSSSTILYNTISGNSATEDGGGIRCRSSSATIRGNTITGNSSYGTGGGIGFRGASGSLYSNTITKNLASGEGGGIYCWSTSLTIMNSILRGDSGCLGKELCLREQSSTSISYCNTENRVFSTYVAPGCTVMWGEGNRDYDPMFVLTAKGDYRLLWHSPCIDSGHPDSLDPDMTRSDIGGHFFDQTDYLTLYLTRHRRAVARGTFLGITYTVINRWAHPESFWLASQAILPNGDTLSVGGPIQHVLPGNTISLCHIRHYVPLGAPLGTYRYRSGIGVPPIVYDQDEFTCIVTPTSRRGVQVEHRGSWDEPSRFRVEGRRE